MKTKYITLFLVALLLLSYSALAVEPQGFSPNEAISTDDTYNVEVEELSSLESFIFQLQETFAITPAVGSDTSYIPNDKVKFATDAQLEQNCNWGYLIFEIYRDTDSKGDNGNLYKVLKDDGHSQLKKNSSPGAYFSFKLPDDSGGEYWAVVVYYTCGDERISDPHDYVFYVNPSEECNVGEVIGSECFDNKVLEYYLDSSCKQQYRTAEDCEGFLESCQNGKCVTKDSSCSDYNGHLCTDETVCNGVLLDVEESNCCSASCSDVVECYADSDCGSGEYCSNNECIEIPVEEVITPEEEANYICCYIKGSGIISPEVSFIPEIGRAHV